MKKRVARILFFKIRSSQEILKIRDGTPWEAEEILTYIKKPSKQIDCHFSTKFDLPSNVVQDKRVARILFFKIRSSQEILKIRDVARILFFKIRSSQEILKIRDGTPLEAEEILTYIKNPRNGSIYHFSTKFDVPTNIVQNKRVARILFFKIRSSQEILKICDGTPLEKNRVTRILVFKSKPSQEILKIRDGTPWEAEEILTYIKKPSKQIDCHFSTKFDLPSNVVQNKKVAQILFFKIRSSQEFLKIRDEILKIRDGTPLEKNRVTRILVFKSKPSQEILKIRDGTPWEAEEILTYIKKPSKQIDCHFSTKFDLPSNVVQNKKVARILFFKIGSSQEFLKIRDGTPLEAEEILTYIKKNRVTRILVFKSKPSQEILKIRDGTPWEAEEILTYIKKPSKQIDCHFSTKFDLPSNVVQDKRVARILFFKISNVLQKKRVARILFFKIRSSQEILKIRDGTPLEAEEILTYIKNPRNGSIYHFSTKFDVPTNIVQNKRVARILFFKIMSSQEILKICDGTPLEKRKNRVTRILVFKSKPSQEILKIRDGTPWEAEEILTYIKKPSKQIDCHFSTKFNLPSNVVQNKRVARILFFKIRSSQEFLKIRDGTPLEAEEILTYIKNNRVTRILVFKSKPSQEILKIRDGTPWEAEEILTYIKKPSKQIDCHFSTKFDLPSNVVQNKRVARILFFKIRSSQEFLKIRDGTPLEAEEILTYIKKKRNNRVTRILVFKSKPSQEILKIRDGTPWEAEEILTYIKKPSKQIDCHFSTKFDLPSNIVQNKRVARILFFKIRSSQEFLKIRDGTPLEAEEILTYIK
ncbi:hypothetical protein OROGR_000824 [Orobanche gracilis]